MTKPGGVVEILSLASGVGFTINAQGQMIVPLSDAFTATLTPGVYKIGVRFTNPDGLITTLVSSRFVVYPELTVLHECTCEDLEVVICADPDVVVIVGPGIPGPAGPAQTTEEQTILEGGSVVIPAGKRFTGLGIRSAVGARTLNLGTTPGGTDLLEVQDLRAGVNEDIGVRKYFPDGGTLYFSGAGTIQARVYIE